MSDDKNTGRDDDDKVLCETPTPGTQPTRIPRWKYDALRGIILEVIEAAGESGVELKALPDVVREKLSPDTLEDLGSVTWHVTAVKLDMEAKGEITRTDDGGPQRLVKA